MVTLTEYLETDLGPDDLESVEDDAGTRFKIRSERAAVWAMRKLNEREEEIAQHIATANAERERIDEWVSEVNGKLTADCSYFTFLLTEWHAEQIEAELGHNPLHGPVDPEVWKAFKHKTRKLPGGDVSAKIGTGRFVSAAPNATVSFLDHVGRDDLVKREPKVSGTLLDAAVDTPDAGVMRDRDGNYLVLCAVDTVEDSAAGARVLEAHESQASALSIIDTFSDVLPAAAELDLEGRNVRLIVTTFVAEIRVETWLVVPGVQKVGVGLVSISVKAKGDA